MLSFARVSESEIEYPKEIRGNVLEGTFAVARVQSKINLPSKITLFNKSFAPESQCR